MIRAKPVFRPKIFGKTFIVHVDASDTMLGFTCNNTHKSEKLNPDDRDTHISFKECLAIARAIDHCPNGSNLIIYTDSKCNYYAWRRGIAIDYRS